MIRYFSPLAEDISLVTWLQVEYKREGKAGILEEEDRISFSLPGKARTLRGAERFAHIASMLQTQGARSNTVERTG